MKTRKRNVFKTARAIVVACLILFTSSTSFGWGPAAHQVIAQIAWVRLSPEAKSEVKQLLGVESFLKASTWADVVRLDPAYAEFKEAHFIDNTFPEKREPPKPNLITALTKNVDILRDKSIDKKAKVEALRFIIHFVGDIHQPLHCASRIDSANPNGDLGGNRVSILVADPRGKLRRTLLHRYWDSGLDSFSETINLTDRQLIDAVAKATKAISESEVSLADPYNYKAWSVESFEVAKDSAYAGIKEGTRITATYKMKGIHAVNVQIARGGYRLATLLNAIWRQS